MGGEARVRLTDREAMALPALDGGSLSALEMCHALAVDTSQAGKMLGWLQTVEMRGLVQPTGGRWALTDAARSALAPSGAAGTGEGDRGT